MRVWIVKNIIKTVYKYISSFSFVDIACEPDINGHTPGNIWKLANEAILQYMADNSEILVIEWRWGC